MNNLQHIRSMAEMILKQVDELENKPDVKPKFKVGDRVNVSRSRVCNDYDYTGTVADVQPGPVGLSVLIRPDSDEQIDYWWSENVLTLSKEAKPKFKVGDRVVWLSDTTNTMFTIIRVGLDQFNMDAHAAGRVTFPNETGVYFVYDVTTTDGMCNTFTFGEAALKPYVEPKAEQREWHYGPPPHVGWWNASPVQMTDVWRWWNGEYWSMSASPHEGADSAAYWAECPELKLMPNEQIQWTDYWPENARVPRIVPDVHLAKNNYKAYYHWHDTNTFEIWHLDPVTGDVTKV